MLSISTRTRKHDRYGVCPAFARIRRVIPSRNFLGTLTPHGVFTLLATLLMIGCGTKNAVNPHLSEQMPQKVLWAWERPEDLRFADPKEFAVAFLAQTIFLQND